MSFNGGTHEGQTGNFEKEVLSCTSYKYMRLSMSDILLSVIPFALVYSFFSCTRVSIIYTLTHSLLIGCETNAALSSAPTFLRANKTVPYQHTNRVRVTLTEF